MLYSTGNHVILRTGFLRGRIGYDRTATAVGKIMFSLFNITSAKCGSISPYTGNSFQIDGNLCSSSLRYPPFTPLFPPRPSPTLKRQSVIIYSINDVTPDYPH